jgi:predicted lactoylglutathione lyase
MKINQANDAQDITALLLKLDEIINAMEQYKVKHPDFDLEAALSERKELLLALQLLKKRELDKFVVYAKEQGTKMSFDAMEMGVLTAGRKDMQDGLAEIVNSLKFEVPVCSECDEKMNNRGLSKKKL